MDKRAGEVVVETESGACKHMVVLGATSDIAVATLKEFAKRGQWHFSLCGRNEEALRRLAGELSSGNVSCSCHYFDTAMSDENMQKLWEGLVKEGRIEVLFCAVGYLGNQKLAQDSPDEGQLIFEANFNGLVPMIALAANYFEGQKLGHIMVISSVAGDRGRCSNYYYGASKAAMSAYLSGLRVRLFRCGVHVINIKPGYVKTRMVAHKKLPPYISASVETVAYDIVKSYYKPKAVVYTMWLWRYIMLATKMLPDFIFKRLDMFQPKAKKIAVQGGDRPLWGT